MVIIVLTPSLAVKPCKKEQAAAVASKPFNLVLVYFF